MKHDEKFSGKDFGEKLYKLRRSNKITREKLANELQISPTTINTYENHGGYPSERILKKICNYFGVSQDYFYTDIHEFKDPTEYGMMAVPLIEYNNLIYNGMDTALQSSTENLALKFNDFARQYIAFDYQGDSLEKIGIFNQDTVIISLSNKDEQSEQEIGKIYFILYERKYVFARFNGFSKSLQRQHFKSFTLLGSKNKLITIKANDLNVIGSLQANICKRFSNSIL